MYHSFSSWTRGSAEGGTRMKRSAWIAFLTAETLLYLSFLFLDLRTGADTKWLKFASILMVALMSFQLNDKIVTAALCLTALADVFLLVLDLRSPASVRNLVRPFRARASRRAGQPPARLSVLSRRPAGRGRPVLPLPSGTHPLSPTGPGLPLPPLSIRPRPRAFRAVLPARPVALPPSARPRRS